MKEKAKVKKDCESEKNNLTNLTDFDKNTGFEVKFMDFEVLQMGFEVVCQDFEVLPLEFSPLSPAEEIDDVGNFDF